MIARVIQREMVSRETGACGLFREINRAFETPRKDWVALTYAFKQRTGHQTLSSSVSEKEERAGKKIGIGRNSIVWFLAKNEASGTRRTPLDSKLICPSCKDRACKALLRRAEAAANRKTVFTVRFLRDAERSGSNGGRPKVSKTVVMLQGGAKRRTVGRSRNIPLNNCSRALLVVTDEPSEKPL